MGKWTNAPPVAPREALGAPGPALEIVDRAYIIVEGRVKTEGFDAKWAGEHGIEQVPEVLGAAVAVQLGDIFAGDIARRMGLPIDKLVIATNQNDILDRALRGQVRQLTVLVNDLLDIAKLEAGRVEVVPGEQGQIAGYLAVDAGEEVEGGGAGGIVAEQAICGTVSVLPSQSHSITPATGAARSGAATARA